MTAKEVLNLNGDFLQSPLLDTLHRIDAYLSSKSIPYAVVGGMAVVRNGAHRTTIDLDILLGREDWDSITRNPPAFLKIVGDSAKDINNQVDIDILHPGNEWEMEIGERDEAMGGVFAGLIPLLTIKCAVYRKKLKEDGIEIAAKDLYDLSELLKARGSEITEADFSGIPASIAATLRDIRRKVT